MLPGSRARHTVNRRNGHLSVNLRHVTGLAGAPAWIVAVQPLLVWHLFRKRPDLLATAAKSLCGERVTRAAQRRVSDVRGLRRTEPSSRGIHDVSLSILNAEGTVFRAVILRLR